MEPHLAYMILIRSSLLREFPHLTRMIEKGGSLFQADDRVASMYVIESGEVPLVRRQKKGAA
jgi:CRP-like cAMP-binding protein